MDVLSMSDAKRMVGSVMASLAMFPGADKPASQKVFLESALNGLQLTLDALAKVQKPTAADLAREAERRNEVAAMAHDLSLATVRGMALQIERLIAALSGVAHSECTACASGKIADEAIAEYQNSQASGGTEHGT
jgi:hypothetical protein